MDTLNESIERLTQSTIDLAEASANVGALKIIFGAFLSLTMLLVITFIYQTFVLNKKLSDVVITTTKVNKYFDEASERTIGKSQVNLLVRRLFYSFEIQIKYFILRSRIEYKNPPKEFINSRINDLIKHEIDNITSYISSFEYEGQPLQAIISSEDLPLIVDFIVGQILKPNNEFSVSDMDQVTSILLDGIKIDYLKTI